MARLPKKKLRLPVGDEWDNLPQSIDEARARGLNRFMKNGEMYELRRSGTDAYPQGKSERVSSRKDNRGTEKRNLSEKIASPDPKVRKEANQYMTELAAKGRVGHHGMGGVTKYAEGKQDFINKQAKLGISPEVAGKDWDIRSGLPEGGHSKANLFDMSIDDHTELHAKTEKEYLNKIKNAGTERDKIFASIIGKTKTNKYNGISEALNTINPINLNPPDNYEVKYTPRNPNGNGNGNGLNGKNGNGLTVNGKNGKNGFLKGMENVKNYSGLGKLRDADQLANIGVNVSTGNYIGAGIGAATYGTSKALQNKQVQARVSKQIMKLVAERGTKPAAKMNPGLDILLSGKESWDYLKRGRWDQAGVAALSGAIGWIPVVGDGASAFLDLSNTGLDIARLQAPTGANKKKGKNRLQRYLKSFYN